MAGRRNTGIENGAEFGPRITDDVSAPQTRLQRSLHTIDPTAAGWYFPGAAPTYEGFAGTPRGEEALRRSFDVLKQAGVLPDA